MGTVLFGPTWPERFLRSGFALRLAGGCLILAGLLPVLFASYRPLSADDSRCVARLASASPTTAVSSRTCQVS